MLFVVDPYYNVPLEKVKRALTDKKNCIRQLCNWNADFIVSFYLLYPTVQIQLFTLLLRRSHKRLPLLALGCAWQLADRAAEDGD